MIFCLVNSDFLPIWSKMESLSHTTKQLLIFLPIWLIYFILIDVELLTRNKLISIFSYLLFFPPQKGSEDLKGL